MMNEVEVRILGCLIEKEISTPEYYPLTLHSLTAACNQKSNRCPVVTYGEDTVAHCLEELRNKGIIQSINAPGSRTVKYRHSFLEEFRLIPSEAVILCELMLRGPQTMGEIRAHTERMYEFKGQDELEETLRGVMERDEPLIIKLQRQSGKKEARYMHMLSGIPGKQEIDQDASVLGSGQQYLTDNERIDKLEEELLALRRELDGLRNSFEEFRAQVP
jgi:uncharacterized protein YceH (UPF0502 family)